MPFLFTFFRMKMIRLFSHHRIVAVIENFYTILEQIHSTENSHVGYKKTLTEVSCFFFGLDISLISENLLLGTDDV